MPKKPQQKATAGKILRGIDAIRKKLGRRSLPCKPRFFLDLGDELNDVFGDPKKGVPYGKIIELFGNPSNGKTAMCIDIAAAAQEDGAHVIWGDVENSFDQPRVPDDGNWYSRRGLECHRGDKKRGIKRAKRFSLIQPYIGKFVGESDPRLITGEELLTEIEATVTENYQQGIEKQILIIDSAAAILTEAEASGGVDGQNMKTRIGLATFLSGLLKRWVALMQNYNCLVIFTNQVRQKPNTMFGNPDYSPGGNAIPFYAHVRVKIALTDGGKIKEGGRTIGIKGELRNFKNKAGGFQNQICRFRIYQNGSSKFYPAKKKEKEE